MKYIPKYQQGESIKVTPTLEIPNGYGNPNESPNRYMLRLYSSPRIKSIIKKENPEWESNKKYYDENVDNLKNWKQLSEDMPDIFTDDYKKTVQGLIDFDNKYNRNPIDIILGTSLNLSNTYKGTSKPLGYTDENKTAISVLPFRHQGTKMYSVPSTYVHEMSHQIFPFTAGKIFEQFPRLNTYFEKTSKNLYSTINNEEVDYQSEATEKLARINELRYNLDKTNIYDATKEDFTSEHYDKMMQLNNPLINQLLEELHTGSIEKSGDNVKVLPVSKKKENIIRLMNEVAENKTRTENPIQYGQQGFKFNTVPRYNSFQQANTALNPTGYTQTKVNKTSEVAEYMKQQEESNRKKRESSDVYTDPASGKTTVQSQGINLSASPIDFAVGGMGALYGGGTKLLGAAIDIINPVPNMRNLAYTIDNHIPASIDKFIKPKIKLDYSMDGGYSGKFLNNKAIFGDGGAESVIYKKGNDIFKVRQASNPTSDIAGIKLTNRVMQNLGGPNTRIVGYFKSPMNNTLQPILKQKYVDGVYPNLDEILNFASLKRMTPVKGYSNSYFYKGYTLGDMHIENFIKDLTGKIRPIDLYATKGKPLWTKNFTTFIE